MVLGIFDQYTQLNSSVKLLQTTMYLIKQKEKKKYKLSKVNFRMQSVIYNSCI